MRENCTVLMMRHPERGRVKTRLAHRIGDRKAFEIYLALLQDTIRAVDTGASDTILSVFRNDTGPTDLEKPFSDMNRFRQKGGDLGERQLNSLRAAYDLGYKKAVVIAGDSPEISAAGIAEAFDTMNNADAVIGPCFDGGYYLLGVQSSKLEPAIFGDITWGKETVAEELRRNLDRLGLSYVELDPLHDVDTFEDLASFITGPSAPDAPITYRIVAKLVKERALSFE